MRILHEDLDENLIWLTQKTEKLKCNRGNFTPPFQGYPPFQQNFQYTPPPHPPPPQVTQFLEGRIPFGEEKVPTMKRQINLFYAKLLIYSANLLLNSLPFVSILDFEQVIQCI